MATPKIKIAIFGTVVLIAFAIVVGLIVHRSIYRNRICEKRNELFYQDPVTNATACLKEKVRGPCGENMLLLLDNRNWTYGIGMCRCDVTRFHRALFYHAETDKCYFIFTQAYCPEGEWLTITNNTDGPFCEKRRCEEVTGLTGPELVPLKDGRCVPLNETDSSCKAAESIRFFRGKLYPICSRVEKIELSLSTVGVPSHDCPDGYSQTSSGHCQPHFDFD